MTSDSYLDDRHNVIESKVVRVRERSKTEATVHQQVPEREIIV
jgi:hypothetical protein